MTYIIGAGITGQIAKKIFPDAKIIATGLPPLPIPFYFWDNKETNLFFEKTGIKFNKRTITVGYIGNNYKKYNILTDKKENNFPCDLLKEISIIEPINFTKETDFYSKDTIVAVYRNCLVGLLGTYKLEKDEKIIWTAHIDKTDFYGYKYKVFYKPISYLTFYSDKELFKENFTYLLEDIFLDKGIYRATKFELRDNKKYNYQYYFEIANKVNIENKRIVKNIVSDYFKIKLHKPIIFTVEKSRAICDGKIIDYGNVFYVGRFAQCNHNIKVEDTVIKLLEVKEK